MNTAIIFLLISISAVLNSARQIPDRYYCYAADPIKSQRSRWSSKTSNEFIRARTIDPIVSSCEPEKFWIFLRHGDRNPSAKDMGRMEEFYKNVSDFFTIFYKFLN